jgi:hypothetical protein
MPNNTQKHRYFVPLIALALVMGVMGLFAIACSSGNSPTEPAAPVGAEGATASTGSLGGGAPIDGAHIDIEKSTNGEDADQGPGPEIVVGSQVTWEYVITNTGSVKLTHITLKDDQIGNIKCPRESLNVGESMTCKATGKAKLGDYENVGRVRAWDPDKTEVGAKDHSHYLGVKSAGKAKIRIEKSTNGEDADEAPGPEIVLGDQVTWEYVVTNTGDVPLTNISVTDNQLGEISCPSTTLEPGESMTCKANGVAELGQYRNVGRVKGTAPDKTEVGDKDDSHYLGVESGGKANIRIEKSTNGEDADSPTGPEIPVGAPVHWEYVVTNTGDVPLSGISVTDDQIGAIVCPSTTLEPGESMTCMAEGIAEEGQYKNVGRVVAKDPDGNEVADKDPSHYFGKEEETGFEGCSHGYWKNHLGSWVPTDYSPGRTVESVFVVPDSISHLGDATLLEALRFGGGPGVEGAAKNLLRQAVGALLNADHPGVAFPMSESEVIDAVNTALASENRHTILSVKDDMDSDNNLGCPLN